MKIMMDKDFITETFGNPDTDILLLQMVGNAIRDAETILKSSGTDCILEWNKGNHFKDPDLRTAKAFAWLMNREDI